MNDKKNFCAIDIMRFIAALFIIALHIIPENGPKTWYSYIIGDVISRLAVPFFFTVSGYLLAYKNIKDNKMIFNYVKRILILYFLWALIYLPANIYLWLTNDRSLILDLLIYIKNFIFIGAFIQFWYFPALIFAVVLIHILIKKLCINKILIISFLLYILGIFGDSYYGFLKKTIVIKNVYDIYLGFFETTRNGLFFGMLFVSIGIAIKLKNFKISIKASLFGFLISLALMFIEVRLLNELNVALDFNMYISLIPAILFLFCTIKEINLVNRPIYKVLRQSSVLIYASHFIINSFLEGIVIITGLDFIINNFLLHFAILSILSIIFSCSILFIQHKTNIKWIKYLY